MVSLLVLFGFAQGRGKIKELLNKLWYPLWEREKKYMETLNDMNNATPHVGENK